MTEDEYLKERVDQQITWYDLNSITAQKQFKRLRRTEIICAAVIPFLSGYSADCIFAQIIIGILGAIVVVSASFLSLGHYQEHWIEYRTTCESLKHEKHLFLMKVEPYGVEGGFSLFVQRVESLISKENSAWAQYTRRGNSDDSADKKLDKKS